MDILKRLRTFDSVPDADVIILMNEAADEIERLREALIEAEKYNGYHQQACLEIERLQEALQRIGDGDTCVSLMTHPPMCKRAYEARSALQQKESK